jgi:hypothetical protein
LDSAEAVVLQLKGIARFDGQRPGAGEHRHAPVDQPEFQGLRVREKAAMAPRAIWSGTISLGLFNSPVRMHGAIDE